MKFLIACLGNIGTEYELTRHNIGFLLADRIATEQKLSFDTDRLAMHAEWNLKGKSIHLIKPTTYMNLSGRAVAYWMHLLKIDASRLLVVCDDLNLDFGKLRLRGKGSSGGQNGLNNINEILGTEQYARLRMGIGNNFAKGRQVDYVLGRFSTEEFAKLVPILDKGSLAVQSFCLEGIDRAMNLYN